MLMIVRLTVGHAVDLARVVVLQRLQRPVVVDPRGQKRLVAVRDKRVRRVRLDLREGDLAVAVQVGVLWVEVADESPSGSCDTAGTIGVKTQRENHVQ